MRVAVIGGSLGGLLTAYFLRRAGVEVQVYERSPRGLSSRGAGIRIQPAMVDILRREGLDVAPISEFTARLKYLAPQGNVIYDEPEVGQFTSWGNLHELLLAQLPPTDYHLGHRLESVEESADGAVLQFSDGRTAHADLVVFCDGVSSMGRALIDPDATLEYAGYVAWRGFVDESEMSASARAVMADATTYAVGDHNHIVFYPMPAHDGPTLVNFVWYRNVAAGADLEDLMTPKAGARSDLSVAPGRVQDVHVDELRAYARDFLPEPARELVLKTKEPFIQPLFDLDVSRMVAGRLVVLGDAAFVARPHAGAGTAKAAENAYRLAQAIGGREAFDADAEAALAEWERSQLELGRRLVERCAWMGDRLQDGETFVPGDPAFQFGLFGPGW